MMKYLEMITNNPIYTQKQTAKELVCSDSTFEKHRNDLKKDSPYSRSEMQKKNPQRSLKKLN